MESYGYISHVYLIVSGERFNTVACADERESERTFTAIRPEKLDRERIQDRKTRTRSVRRVQQLYTRQGRRY